MAKYTVTPTAGETASISVDKDGNLFVSGWSVECRGNPVPTHLEFVEAICVYLQARALETDESNKQAFGEQK